MSAIETLPDSDKPCSLSDQLEILGFNKVQPLTQVLRRRLQQFNPNDTELTVQALRSLICYGSFLNNVLGLMEAAKISCQTEAGQSAIQFLYDTECGKLSSVALHNSADGTPADTPTEYPTRAQLFEEILSLLRVHPQYGPIIEMRDLRPDPKAQRPLNLLIHEARANPIAATVSLFSIYEAFDYGIKPYNYGLTDLLGLSPFRLAYFEETGVSESLDRLAAAYAEEAAAAKPKQLDAIYRIASQAYALLDDIFGVSYPVRSASDEHSISPPIFAAAAAPA